MSQTTRNSHNFGKVSDSRGGNDNGEQPLGQSRGLRDSPMMAHLLDALEEAPA